MIEIKEGGQAVDKPKNHYPWWGYVRYIIRRYPELDKITDGQMSRADSKNWRAVRSAVNYTERMESGMERLKVIRMAHWDRTHTLEGAAHDVPCDRATAARWQRKFFEEVARNMGFLD